jgi:hypothetical protein
MHQSLYGDELFAYDEISGHTLFGVVDQVRTSIEVSPPLFFVLAWASGKLGDLTTWIRLPSLLAGTALVPTCYLLGLRSVGRMAAILAAAVVAIAPFAIFYSTEARPYATLALLSAASAICLLCALDSPRHAWWVAYAVAAAAVTYTHYTGVFVLAAQVVWAVSARPDRWRELGLATLAAVVLYLPWLPLVKGKGALTSYGPFDSSIADVLLFVPKALVGHPFVPLTNVPGAVSLGALAVAVLVGAVWAAWERSPAARGAIRRAVRSRFAFLALQAISAPIGLLLYAAATNHNLLLVRNLSASFPASVLALSAVVSAPPRKIALPLAGIFLAALAVGTVKTLDKGHRRPPYNEAAAIIDARARPGDSVLDLTFRPSGPRRALTLYTQRAHTIFSSFQVGEAWKHAARTSASVFVVFPRVPSFTVFIGPPDQPHSRFHVAHRWYLPGLTGGVAIREYTQRTPRTLSL